MACYAVTLSGSQSHCCCQLHILLPVLAESALNMHVLLQFWLVVLQYANTASSLGRCCSTLPCMFAFSHGCIGLNMQILLSVWFVLLHVTVQVMLLSCLVLLAHAGVAHTLMMQPLLIPATLQLQYCVLATCRNRALHQRLHHSAAASHKLPLPQEAAARGGAPGQGQIPAVPEASSPGLCSGPVCGSADIHQALRH